jgi:hypothetical protein
MIQLHGEEYARHMQCDQSWQIGIQDELPLHSRGLQNYTTPFSSTY